MKGRRTRALTVKRALQLLGLTLALAGATRPSFPGNLVINSGFEDPPLAVGDVLITTAIPGWTSTIGSGVEIQHKAMGGEAGSPYEGNQHVELDSYDPSNIVQDVPTTTGAYYRLSVAYSPRPGSATTPYGGDAASNEIEVYWDGARVDTLQGQGGESSETVWEVKIYDRLLASTSSTRLEFRDVSTPDSFGGYIDDVRVEAAESSEPRFIRGDADSDGKVSITDAIFTLNYLFIGGAPPGCYDAADSDDDGALNLTDAVYTLGFLFLGGPAPPEPFGDCGVEARSDDLGCESFAPCTR